jgi:DNA-binding SARP family transcriptional activator
MLYLKTFGGLSLTADGVTSGAAGQQRKTLALVALLATAGRRGVSRDKLIGYLWPDADHEHARRLLKQACYVLRRDLHAPDLFLGATELRLNPAILTSDVQSFEAAVEQGDLSQAVGLFLGPFLDGFYLSDSAEFEHWVEAERDRLGRRFCEALEKLARDAVAQGDNRAAAGYWRRLLSLDPFNPGAALGLMQALSAAGDLPRALEVAQEHQARLREELDVGPDPAVIELAERLRLQSAGRRTLPPVREDSPPTPELTLEEKDAWPALRRRTVPRAGRVALAGVVLTLLAASLLSHTGRRSTQGTRVVTFNVLGPDGRNSICNFLPTAALVTARLLNATPPPRQGGFGAFTCPESQLRLSVPAPGAWHVRLDLPPVPSLGALPSTGLEAADVSRDIVIREGARLGGRGTFEGKPVEGVGMVIGWEAVDRAMASPSGSGPDGRWRDIHGRPTVLQKNVRYTLNAVCQYLGARLVNTSPAGGFLFPAEKDSIDCAMAAAPNARFAHDHTRLVVTPMPGDIGGLSADFAGSWGYGWGVQFPVPAGRSPSHQPYMSHLYQGALLIGRAPDQVLSGGNLTGVAACGRQCRNLGLDARAKWSSLPGAGKRVLWEYSDSGAPEAAGLRVVQESFDGRPPADYVLFRFAMTNSGPAATTFHAGFFGDWDVGDNAEDDVGFTDMDGRLMYLTNTDRTDPFLGTVLISDAPISGNYFFRKETLLSRSEQVDALAGRIVRTETDITGDARYIHGAGPFQLDRGEQGELWIAVVAGETKDQLLASAAAAVRDIDGRTGGRTVRRTESLRGQLGRSNPTSRQAAP